MFQADIEDGRPFRIFYFKQFDYVMNIMALWITIDELEGGNTECN